MSAGILRQREALRTEVDTFAEVIPFAGDSSHQLHFQADFDRAPSQHFTI